MTTETASLRRASLSRPRRTVLGVLIVLSLGVTASFAQTGLIEPSEDGLTLPVGSSDTSSDGVSDQSGPDEPLFTINFRDADILEVLEAYSNLLNVNVVPGEGVSGIVTVISPGPVSYTHLTLPTNREV